MLRADLPRSTASEYWAKTHASIVRSSLPHVVEYNQHHFSKDDHSYWPSAGVVGSLCPTDYDGIAELRFPSVFAALRNLPHSRPLYFDEQNPFDTLIAYQTGQGGGRWWTDGLDESVGHRTVVLLRQRKGIRARRFRAFVHEGLGAALREGGARDLRTYTFMRYVAALWSTPGVNHAEPPNRRHHGALVIGADSREHLHQILSSAAVVDAISDQGQFITGAHAYTVARTVPGIRVAAATR